MIEVFGERKELHILNISSVLGKEHKLKFVSNVLLKHSILPLSQASFVKADSCQKISFETAKNFKLMGGGAFMHQDDFNSVISTYKKFSQ